MTILSDVKEALNEYSVGTIFTRQEIISIVVRKYGHNPTSIIPSDYCYNRINNGIDFDNYLHIFEYTIDKRYKYLGVNYPYTGKIYHKPKGAVEIVVGQWENGKTVLESDDDPKNKEFLNNYSPNVTKEEICDIQTKAYHRTNRQVNMRLRFDVMKRDNFKCCLCGASPAKDPSVVLHIDHILPWSCGGETTFDNLQTLCAECNLGKGTTIL